MCGQRLWLEDDYKFIATASDGGWFEECYFCCKNIHYLLSPPTSPSITWFAVDRASTMDFIHKDMTSILKNQSGGQKCM
jgi:hypothetical protein